MIIIKNDLSFNSYISSCDLINKYNSKTLHNIPKINSISLKVLLSNLIKNSTKEITPRELQYKSFFVFYFLTSFFPKIQHFLKPGVTMKDLKNEEKYVLQYNFLKKDDINSFLDIFFSEIYEKNIFNKKINKMKNEIQFFIPFSSVKEGDTLLNSENFNLKNFNLLLKFSFNKKLNKKNLQNLPCFWMSG